MKRKRSENIRQILVEISELLVKGVIAFFGFLGYATTVRSFIGSYYGSYWIGLVDGLIVAATSLAIAIYAYSLRKD